MESGQQPVSADDIGRLKQRMLGRQRELTQDIAVLGEELAESAEEGQRDVGDAGDEGEREQRATVRHAEQQRDADELEAIERALARIEDGTYGSCIDCGEDIPLPRLEAQPWAERCVPCQELHERQVGVGAPML